MSLKDCPKARAIRTPIKPEMKNLIDRAAKGEEYKTIIRAEVNADDQMITKTKPNKSARIFIGCLSIFLRTIKVGRKIKGSLKATLF